jgi:acetolactate synthase-1/2/3 large subunit
MNKTNEMSGGQAIASRIAERDIGTVFALAGAGHTHLLTAVEDLGITIVGGRHESGTVIAADGYARTSGKIGIALIIAEQGLPNAINGIMTAFHAASPVVILLTCFPEAWNEPSGEFVPDHHALVGSITKWARSVPSPGRLVEYFDTACRIASEGQPGPVILIFPGNFLAHPIAAPSKTFALPASRPAADPTAIEKAAALLADAERPIIVVDAGACWGNAGPGLQRLTSDHGLTVFGHGLGRGLVPEDDDKSYPWSYAQPAARMADVVLIVGAHMNIWFGFGRPPRFSADARFIQIDIQAEAISRNHPVDIPIQADPGIALNQLADALDRMGRPSHDRSWLVNCLASRRDRVGVLARPNQGPIHPLEIGRAVASQVPADAVLVGDGADILNWTYGNLRVRRERGYMDHQPMGAMGVGLPLAIGAASAEKERAKALGVTARRVLLVSGDGALGFYIAELDTARRAALAMTVIVSNDGLWSTEYHGQHKTVGRTVNTALGRSNYAQVADAFGCSGVEIEDRAELGQAIEAALLKETPVLLDIHIDPEAGRMRKEDPLVNMIIFEDLAPKSPGTA